MAYVYIWKRPNGIPFYVGIGKTKTRWNPNSMAQPRNRHCRSIVRKYGPANILVEVIEGVSWGDACRLEQTLIAWFGRKDLELGPLVNMTDGGDGAPNPSNTKRSAQSELMKRLNADPEFRAKRIARLKESSDNISAGVKRSAEARAKTVATPEVQAKLRRPKTAEHNAKISAAKKVWWAAKKLIS